MKRAFGAADCDDTFAAACREADAALRNIRGGPRARDRVEQDQQEAEAVAFSDDALALAFAERHASELRHVANWSRWLTWSGTRWQGDDTLAVFDRARAICRGAAADCSSKAKKLKKELASAKTVAAVERLARADRRLAATAEQWDASVWSFNTGDDQGEQP
jgi:putative DNA primase/helicase